MKPGKSTFNWHAGSEFFKTFENSEILDADLEILVEVENFEDSVEVECTIDGTVVVICDRCLEELTLPVHTSFESEALDLSQDIYDFVCTSLPMQKVHPDGECNEDTVKFLCK